MKKENIFLFVLIFLLSFGSNVANLCRGYLPFTFDNQILLTWEYSALIGQVPFRDLFYPYGLFNYYKTQNLYFSLIYLLLAPLLFTFLFIAIKKIFNDRLFSYFSTCILFLFVFKFTGFDVFSRYGILIVIATFLGHLFYEHKGSLPRKIVLFFGVFLGSLLPFFIDQAIYSFTLFIIFFIIDKFLWRVLKGISNIYKIFFDLMIFVLGFLLGLSPFLIYLSVNNNFFQFLVSLSELSDLQLLAKTPFFHSFSTDNIFTLVGLLLVLFFLSYKIFIKSHVSPNTYFQIGLVLSLIIIEQKNVVRHIDNQLSFIGLLLFISLFYELKNILSKYKVSNLKIFLYYINIAIVVLFLMGLRGTDIAKDPVKACLKNETRFNVISEKHELVKKEIEKMTGFNGKIFSYPGDIIFHLLFKQSPFYYPSSFEASSRRAQEKLIAQIMDQKIEYIIYNYKNTAIQDEVPNLVRTVILHRYILENYSIENKTGDFLILKKNKNKKDFFRKNNINYLPEFKNILLHVDLENIPRSEGIYKSKDLFAQDIRVLISSSSLGQLNNYIKNNKMDSNRKFLIIEFNKKTNDRKSLITIKTKNGLESDIEFKTCEAGRLCIINISNIPLFYRSRIINEITIDNNHGVSNVKLMYIPASYSFW